MERFRLKIKDQKTKTKDQNYELYNFIFTAN